ncbi:endothelin-converting enzyme homolog [Trichonephila inaurata madagascariensis]|uniref:Endothelin-converting enzyme homolog n=1 Tax=Trichonephila inaurata madagascariensis TaxID=2747483 RepID=A0A8X6YEU8_9ARAC|nr:endothelin-converting enzyme homolog [Trichonephila inaurata madagascariensis]
MIQGIKESFKDNLPSLKWMDPETRKLAAEKVDSMIDTVGYPEFILYPDQVDEHYEGIVFNETDYFQNLMNLAHYERVKNMKKLDIPTNRTEWIYAPTELNAYYILTSNQIGMHEKRSLYDKYGSLHQWWKDSTFKNFQELTQCFVEQYSSYEVQGMKVNGQLTLGENIADNGGLKASFNAYQNWITRNHAEQPLPGLPLTSNQLFFVAYAQKWCEISTPEMERFFSF